MLVKGDTDGNLVLIVEDDHPWYVYPWYKFENCWFKFTNASPRGPWVKEKYSQVSNISCTLVGNKIVDHSDVVGASPVGAAPTTSSFST